jgi:uncharacterized protein YkwD
MRSNVDTARRVHVLINSERRRRGLQPVYWSRGCTSYAQSSADSCAKLGKLIHARLLGWDGGENLAFRKGNFAPRAIVSCWMHSKTGHRENLLNSQATRGGVAVTRSGNGMYVAWIFSRTPPQYPDCPGYGVHRQRAGFFNRIVKFLFGK